jgi:hypothetical protein
MKTCGTCASFKRLGMSDPKWGECGYKMLIPDAAEFSIDPGYRNVREDDVVTCPCWARKIEPLPTGPDGKCCQVCRSWSPQRLHCNEPQTWEQEMRNGVDCEFFRSRVEKGCATW